MRPPRRSRCRPRLERATLVYDTTRFGTALVYGGDPAAPGPRADVLDVTITLRAAGTPSVRDPYTGVRRPPISTSRDAATNRTHRPRPAARRALHPRLRRRARPTPSPSAATSPAAPSCRSARSSRGTSRRAPPTIACSSATSSWRGWSSTSGRRRPIPASTSSPRTASSPIAPASSGRSCRSRSTARSGAPTGRRSRCCRPRRCCRRRSTCGWTPTTATASTAPRPSTAPPATSSASRRAPRRPRSRSTAARCGSIARRSGAASCRRSRPGWARPSSRTTRRCTSRTSARPAAARCSCRSRRSRGRSCSSPAATSWSRRLPASATTSSIPATSRRGASRRGAAIA